MKLVAKVIPVLNARDSDRNPKYVGPETTKIPRYLLVLCMATSEPIFRSLGKEIDNSIYFTLYRLWTIAHSFKDIPPYHLPITYDRTKVAGKIYKMLSENGLVTIKNIEGDTCVAITKKGEEVSERLLEDISTEGMSDEVKSTVYGLSNLLSGLDDQGGYFIDFISTRGIQAGIIRLHPGQKDTQEPHSVDEVYYVIEGSGFIRLDGKDHAIRQGTSIFVPAKADHRFHGNKEHLIIFYALGGRN